jgi:putative transposase
MPRRPRRFQQGDYYHVVNRASLRARLFQSSDDYQLFIDLLSRTVETFQLPVFAYCVMPNHWHLVAAPATHTDLSRSMHWLTGTHAARWCRAHARPGPGPVYQDRFWSVPIQSGIHVWRVVRYVERNALAAQMVARAEDWPWCSAQQRVRNDRGPTLQPLEILPPAEWSRYLDEPVQAADIGDAIRRNLPIGDDEWIRQRRESLGLRRPGRPCKK